MRDVLCHRLFEAHPDLYALRHAPPGENAIRDWGIEHGDGWFAITAALSEVVAARVSAARVHQCKAKFTSYCFYLGGENDFCRGAIQAAGHVAQRVSEVSGRAGRPMTERPPLVFVRAAPEVEKGWWNCSGLPEAPASVGALRARHAGVLAGAVVEVPEPCLDLADGWLDGVPAGARLARLGVVGDAGAEAGAGDEVLGAVAFLNRLAGRVDRATGAIGPVDDRGVLYVTKRRPK